MSDPVRQLTHLPIWLNGRRPGWWPHMELRAFLTISHRQMLLKDCHAEALAKFGAVTPSISGLHRYWQRLDEVFGHAASKFLTRAISSKAAGTPMQPTPQVRK